MELDLETQFADRAYPILASLVTPRPIAFVTTISPEGKVNAAPFSFFNLLGAEPPILAIAPGDRDDGTPKDTARNNAPRRSLTGLMSSSKTGCTPSHRPWSNRRESRNHPSASNAKSGERCTSATIAP
jgi:hypothetical protein